jgi:hypothetical protein
MDSDGPRTPRVQFAEPVSDMDATEDARAVIRRVLDSSSVPPSMQYILSRKIVAALVAEGIQLVRA